MQIEDMFGEVISTYTEEMAIEDGVLHHLYPAEWPWLLITNSVFELCKKEAVDSNRTLDQVVRPLLIDVIREVQRVNKINRRIDLVELEFTAAGTIWCRPNSRGGITVMVPADN